MHSVNWQQQFLQVEEEKVPLSHGEEVDIDVSSLE